MLKRPCHYFNSTGKCRFGKHCKFLHNIDTIVEDNPTAQQHHEVVSELSTASNSASSTQASTFETTSYQDEGINQISRAASVEESSSVEICKFYARSRFCRYGNRCKYRHVQRQISSELKEKNWAHVDDLKVDDGSQQNTVQDERAVQEPTDVNCRSYCKDGENQIEVCPFYAKSRFCRYGNRCKYRHIRKKPSDLKQKSSDGDKQAHAVNKNDDNQEIPLNDKVLLEDDKREILAIKPPGVDNEYKKSQKQIICRFYKKGSCKFGRKCRNFHPQDNTEQKTEDKSEPINSKSTISKPPQILSSYSRDSMNFDLQRKLRQTEIEQLKRRFPPDKLTILQESSDCSRFLCSIAPTDPDWPYDARMFVIEVIFHEDYPLKLFELAVPVEQDLPETVRRYIEVSLQEWVDTKQQQLLNGGIVELVFRPFLRWFDRSLESIVTEALRQLRRELTAKAAGFEFIPATKATGTESDAAPPAGDDDEDDATEDNSEAKQEGVPLVYRKKDVNPDDEVYTGPERSSDEDSDDDGSEDSDEVAASDGSTPAAKPQIDIDTPRRGTELAFRNMQLWYCTTVMLQRIHLAVQCDRCKNKTEFSTPPNRVNSIACAKCHSSQLAVFRPVLAHSYSSTFGYLDLDGCQAFDVILQDCVFAIGCIGCNKEVVIKTFAPGKVLEMWCRGCHTKMKFATETVKLSKLVAAGVDPSAFSGRVHQVGVSRVRKPPKDGAIQEGKPLPDNGSCKHYKKSFRWLRFPCCGKTYPCDVCHDDKESHEMKYANRMICGYCCREQPYAVEKPCMGCGSSLTKVHSTHWEGGKGCRDKISMNKSDKQKFANLHKTVSKKSQALKEMNAGKKNTKLRHT